MKDTFKRSLLKTVSWRVVGTLDTMLLALLYTGDQKVAMWIGSTEVFTKVGLYYLHERAWNRVKWGRSESTVIKSRSLVKSIVWRTIGTLDTLFISLFYSNDLKVSAMIGGTETVTKIFLYYFHERMWALVKWGRVYL